MAVRPIGPVRLRVPTGAVDVRHAEIDLVPGRHSRARAGVVVVPVDLEIRRAGAIQGIGLAELVVWISPRARRGLLAGEHPDGGPGMIALRAAVAHLQRHAGPPLERQPHHRAQHMAGAAIRALRAHRPQMHPIGFHHVQVHRITRRIMPRHGGEGVVVGLAGVHRAADGAMQVALHVVQEKPVADGLRRRHVGTLLGTAHAQREGDARTGLHRQTVAGLGIGDHGERSGQRLVHRRQRPLRVSLGRAWGGGHGEAGGVEARLWRDAGKHRAQLCRCRVDLRGRGSLRRHAEPGDIHRAAVQQLQRLDARRPEPAAGEGRCCRGSYSITQQPAGPAVIDIEQDVPLVQRLRRRFGGGARSIVLPDQDGPFRRGRQMHVGALLGVELHDVAGRDGATALDECDGECLATPCHDGIGDAWIQDEAVPAARRGASRIEDHRPPIETLVHQHGLARALTDNDPARFQAHRDDPALFVKLYSRGGSQRLGGRRQGWIDLEEHAGEQGSSVRDR